MDDLSMAVVVGTFDARPGQGRPHGAAGNMVPEPDGRDETEGKDAGDERREGNGRAAQSSHSDGDQKEDAGPAPQPRTGRECSGELARKDEH